MGSIGANRSSGGMGFTMGGGGIQPAGGGNGNGTQPVTPVNSNNPNVQNQTPNASNTPVVSQAVQNLSSLDDASMAALINAAKSAQLPNYLGDVVDDRGYPVKTPLTQRVVVQAGVNEKPLVLDQQAYNQFLQDNNISSSDQLARSVGGNSYTNADGTQVNLKADQIADILKYSRMNYIGGRHGGNYHGDGTYFDQNGGRTSSGYTQNGGSGRYANTSSTVVGVLNPRTARVIADSQLGTRVQSWISSHPQTARAIGSYSDDTKSVYAMCMGYNVIKSGSYHNVIDRSALVLKA